MPSPACAAALSARPCDAATAAAAGVPEGAAILHASCVALASQDPVAALILGPSGSGKSTLALELVSRGGVLVADDRVALIPGPRGPIASAPAALAGLVEARGLGILRLTALPRARLVVAVDLSAPEPERLPPTRTLPLPAGELPLVLSPSPAALFALLLAGGLRRAP